ncbi:MAG: ATP-grasp domain-containing protein [Crocinitomicaceae bacterium]|nr:ATP-grasp domain-containing protein [Crocinitomicaceae bacterium]
MFVLIQSNVRKDPDFDKIYPILDELSISYETIHLDASVNTLTIHQDRTDVFVYGSVKLAMLAKENHDWYPGSFYSGNHLFEINSQFYKEHLLNYSVEVRQLSDVLDWKNDPDSNQKEEKFIKPYQYAKLFTGQVYTKSKWENFVENTLKNPHTPLINAHSLIQVSEPRDIVKEARLWIVGGIIVESVYYKILKDIPFEEQVSEEGLEFARQMISIFNVADAFVMDICLTDIGWKIVEVNCINSAGFFPNTDIKKVFGALNAYF